MTLASDIWRANEDPNSSESVVTHISAEELAQSLKSARASQRKEKTGPLSTPTNLKMPGLVVYTSATIADIRAWKREIRTRRDENTGRFVLDKTQFVVIEKVTARICEEMGGRRDWRFQLSW